MPAPPSRPVRAPHELLLLLTLATVQFTHVVDFMVIMPLGPQFMRLFDVGPREFGLRCSRSTPASSLRPRSAGSRPRMICWSRRAWARDSSAA
jgi:hypothetical protein